MTPAERYHFDLAGYVIVRQALEPGLLHEVNAVVDGFQQRAALDLHGARPHDREPCYDRRFESIILEDPVFQRVILCPALVRCIPHLVSWPRLKSTWLDFKALHGAIGFHANHTPHDPLNHYHFQDGRICANHVTCCFALQEVPADGGALQVIPGSHKANLRLPDDEQALAAMRRPLALQAGDCLLFSHDLNHGSVNQRDYVRRTVFATVAPGCAATRIGTSALHERLHQEAAPGSWRRYLLRRAMGDWIGQEPPAHAVEDELAQVDGAWRWASETGLADQLR